MCVIAAKNIVLDESTVGRRSSFEYFGRCVCFLDDFINVIVTVKDTVINPDYMFLMI